ncbi:MAG: hypothetical protein IJA69_06520 [Clostridia bacterium]|nr:hypothetical protein [Clostridia bacterium]
MSKKLAIIIVCIAIALIGGVVAFFVISNSPPPPPDNADSNTNENNSQPEITLPTITVPQTLEMYVGDCKEFSVVVEETELEYEITNTISNNSVCSLTENNIVALGVGQATISTTITVGEKSESKSTTIKVYDPVTNVNCSLLTQNQIVDTIYKNETYYAKFEFDSVLLSIPNFSCSNNVTMSLYESTNTCFTFEFSVNSSDDFCFGVNFLNINKEFTYHCYDYISEINATFDNAKYENNVYKLFLFNKTYKTEANADGFYDESEITININQSAFSNYQIILSSPVAEIIDNKIFAKSDGEFVLTIKSNDKLSYEKSYNFVNETLSPKVLNCNDISSKVNEPKTITYEILPIYSLYDNVEISCNSTYVSISENNIISSTIGTYDICVKVGDIQKIIKFNVTSDIGFSISINQSIVDTYNITISDNIVNLNYVSNFMLAINFEVNAENLNNLIFNISATSNNETFDNFSYDNSRILFEVTKIENIVFTITCPTQPSLSFEIVVNVN